MSRIARTRETDTALEVVTGQNNGTRAREITEYPVSAALLADITNAALGQTPPEGVRGRILGLLEGKGENPQSGWTLVIDAARLVKTPPQAAS